MKGRILIFQAIYKDGELLENECDVSVNCSLVSVKGELRKPVWDPINVCFRTMYGLFIEFEGHEYGTLTETQQQFIDACNGVGVCCDDGSGDADRIHVSQFAIEFV